MTWVTWRQHRGQAMVCLAVLAVLTLVLLPISTQMRSAFSNGGVAECLVHNPGTSSCHDAIGNFMSRFSVAGNQFLVMLLFVPGLIGVIVGAPLLGRELEEGTWRMAWSQTVPRTRWLISKLALLTGGFILFGATMTAVFSWYRAPMDRLSGHFTFWAYDSEGLAPTAYLLCAFAFAVLAGLLARRSIGGMVAAFAAWAAVRGAVDFSLRQHVQQPLAAHLRPDTSMSFGPNVASLIPGHAGDWILSAGTTGKYGWITYQPASRFWTFQLIEAGLYLALTAVALGVAVLLLRRRAA